MSGLSHCKMWVKFQFRTSATITELLTMTKVIPAAKAYFYVDV